MRKRIETYGRQIYYSSLATSALAIFLSLEGMYAGTKLEEQKLFDNSLYLLYASILASVAFTAFKLTYSSAIKLHNKIKNPRKELSLLEKKIEENP
jgi:hypothetical protein